jgi:hypothetical protein
VATEMEGRRADAGVREGVRLCVWGGDCLSLTVWTSMGLNGSVVFLFFSVELLMHVKKTKCTHI